jgi:thiamine pyrophosphate-dependent acetolactate synthase large subunit-like protein
LFFECRHAETTLPQLDFCQIAKGFGYQYTQLITDISEFDSALRAALENETGPSRVHCKLDSDTMVLPMVAPGASIDKIVMSIS